MVKIFIGNISKLINKTDYDLVLNQFKERSEKRKKEKRAGEILLLEALKREKILITEPLVYEYRGTKPYLKDYPYYYNISHSGDKIALVISDKEVGIDIEEIKKRARRIAHSIVSVEEIKYFFEIAEENYESSIIKMWTIKEAFLKYLGIGITKELDNVKLNQGGIHLRDQNAKYHTFQYDNYFVTTVTKEKEEREIVLIES